MDFLFDSGERSFVKRGIRRNVKDVVSVASVNKQLVRRFTNIEQIITAASFDAEDFNALVGDVQILKRLVVNHPRFIEDGTRQRHAISLSTDAVANLEISEVDILDSLDDVQVIPFAAVDRDEGFTEVLNVEHVVAIEGSEDQRVVSVEGVKVDHVVEP